MQELKLVRDNLVRQYSDLDLDFIAHPLSGDIVPLLDVDSVKRSIRNLILTATNERYFQPNLGSGLKQLLFENISPLTARTLEIMAEDVIKYNEPRASVINVKANINDDYNGYDIVITFAVDRLSIIDSVDVFLEKVR